MNKNSNHSKFQLCALLTFLAFLASSALAQSESLDQRIRKIMERPEFAHSRFGIEFYSLDTGKVVYERNSRQLFVPGSTTKLFTEGTALELLGADYRFHTRVYRTGPIEKDGTLNGDLISSAAAIQIFPIAFSPTALWLLKTKITPTAGPTAKAARRPARGHSGICTSNRGEGN
jgi:D-alanyl-D-alanine carboxypeptidase (penicillin-binding protein 4)